jgi:hypothetical protein
MRNRQLFSPTFVSAIVALFSCHAMAQDNTPPPLVPSATTVAVLPAPNISKDKWEELKVKESAKARDTVRVLLLERGFKVVDDATVDNGVQSLKIDFKDEEQWTKPNLYAVGDEVKADLVVFVVIKQTRQKTTHNILMTRVEGEAEIEVWFVDARSKTPLLNGVPARGKGPMKMGERAEDRRLEAVKRAVTTAFDKPLKSYPVINPTKPEEKK